ncbi:MAG: hypothetical protein ACTHNB_09745 [Gaiellaceae bacterium]
MIRSLRFSSPAFVAAFVALFVALSGAVAIAATSLSKPLVTDPRDAGGKLDLRAARRIGKDRTCLVTISTWGSWSSTILQGENYVPGKNKLLVLYDLNGDNKPDLTGQIIFVFNHYLYLFIKASDGNLRPGSATRTTPSSVAVQVCGPLFDLQSIPTTVRVAFESVNRTHRDRMPNRGWIRLRVL